MCSFESCTWLGTHARAVNEILEPCPALMELTVLRFRKTLKMELDH